MPLLGFMKVNAPKVESGEKRCTIRALRKDKRDPKRGETLYIYTGLRSKSCRKLVTPDPVCKKARPIWFDSRAGVFIQDVGYLKHTELESLAKADGFDCVKDFIEFFKKKHGFPFRGLLIEW